MEAHLAWQHISWIVDCSRHFSVALRTPLTHLSLSSSLLPCTSVSSGTPLAGSYYGELQMEAGIGSWRHGTTSSTCTPVGSAPVSAHRHTGEHMNEHMYTCNTPAMGCCRGDISLHERLREEWRGHLLRAVLSPPRLCTESVACISTPKDEGEQPEGVVPALVDR